MKMMKKINSLYKKYKEIINYLIFGVLTTVISLAVYYALVYTILNPLNAIMLQIANILSWTAGVIFAYITNKDLVFHSEADSFKERIIEFCKFMLGRAFTMVVEFVGGLILFELPIPNIITKMGLTIIVIILNFFISKFFAFKSKKDN